MYICENSCDKFMKSKVHRSDAFILSLEYWFVCMYENLYCWLYFVGRFAHSIYINRMRTKWIFLSIYYTICDPKSGRGNPIFIINSVLCVTIIFGEILPIYYGSLGRFFRQRLGKKNNYTQNITYILISGLPNDFHVKDWNFISLPGGPLMGSGCERPRHETPLKFDHFNIIAFDLFQY